MTFLNTYSMLTLDSDSAKNLLTFFIGNIPKILGMFPIKKVDLGSFMLIGGYGGKSKIRLIIFLILFGQGIYWREYGNTSDNNH